MKAWKRWIFYFLLSTPLMWLAYQALTDNLGAEPAAQLNKQLGDYTLYLLLINLYWGCYNRLISERHLRKWQSLRRPLGVACFAYALLHFTSYFIKEGDLTVAATQLVQKAYLIFGLLSLLILFVLAITSNNWSIRQLKYARWQILHRFVYLGFILISVHILLIEKRSWLTNKYTLYPMAVIFIARWFKQFHTRTTP